MLFLSAGVSAPLLQNGYTARTVQILYRHFDTSSTPVLSPGRCGPTFARLFGFHRLSHYDRHFFHGRQVAPDSSAGDMGSVSRRVMQWHCTSSGQPTAELSMTVPIFPVPRSPTNSAHSCIGISGHSHTPATPPNLAIFPLSSVANLLS
jgi:hypothetical protein